jgi:hypothetical protein
VSFWDLWKQAQVRIPILELGKVKVRLMEKEGNWEADCSNLVQTRELEIEE